MTHRQACIVLSAANIGTGLQVRTGCYIGTAFCFILSIDGASVFYFYGGSFADSTCGNGECIIADGIASSDNTSCINSIACTSNRPYGRRRYRHYTIKLIIACGPELVGSSRRHGGRIGCEGKACQYRHRYNLIRSLFQSPGA